MTTQQSTTHWRRLLPVEHIGAYILQPGEEKILTIKSAGQEKIKGQDGTEKLCLVLHFEEAGVKPMVCNATNAKTISRIHKSPYLESWPGKRIQIYATSVKAFGEVTEALRIRDYIPKDETIDPTSAISRLQTAKTLGELKIIYDSLSKAEQANDKVIGFKDKLKGTLK